MSNDSNNNAPSSNSPSAAPNNNLTIKPNTKSSRKHFKDLDAEAEKSALAHVEEITELLYFEANVQATRDKASRILASHVEDAWRIVRRANSSDWKSQLALLLGGAAIGSGGQGFIGELGINPMRPAFVATYAIIFVVGLFGGFWAIWREKR